MSRKKHQRNKKVKTSPEMKELMRKWRKQDNKKIRETHKISGFHNKPKEWRPIQGGAIGLKG